MTKASEKSASGSFFLTFFLLYRVKQKKLREDAQTAEMELIAAQYRGRARVLQAKLFVPLQGKAKKAPRGCADLMGSSFHPIEHRYSLFSWESFACQFPSFRIELTLFAQT